MTKSLKPTPKIVMPPGFGADHSLRISYHEAGHAVAHYLFGNAAFDAEAHERRGVTRVPRTDDVFAQVVCLLAGEAFERSIGLKFAGSTSDLDKADALLATVCSGAALDEAARVCEEAAISLVESERFQTMAFALGKVIARERYVGEKQIRRILEEADPERERHSLESHSERTRPSVPWSDHPVGPHHTAACIVCLAHPDRARAAKAKAHAARRRWEVV